MKTSNFEGVKVALKQDKTGYVLTLSIHPDDVPVEILRDFVGARYQVVMVRLNGDEQPMDRDNELGFDPVQLAGILCRELSFMEYLFVENFIDVASEEAATEWLRKQLGVQSRTQLRGNKPAAQRLRQINEAYKEWKRD
ncbi:MAG: hypothetical protein RJA72_608 [Pseudomonadota bacterium]|jgi:hypothetical protein